MVKIIGAASLIVGGFAVGFSVCQKYRRSKKMLQQLIQSLQWMILKLEYQMPTLSSMCRQTGQVNHGTIAHIFTLFADELDRQLTPEVSACMSAALSKADPIPEIVQLHFQRLGESLGQFDLQGQITLLEEEVRLCQKDLDFVRRHLDGEARHYQTLGLCAGTALAVLLL